MGIPSCLARDESFTEGRQGGGGTGRRLEWRRNGSAEGRGGVTRSVGSRARRRGGGGLEIVEKVGGGGGVGVLAPLSGPPPFFVQLLPTVRATEGWGGGAGRVWGAGCGSSPESTACCSLRQPATGWREGGTGEGGGGRVEGVRDVGARDAGVAVGQTLRRGEGGEGREGGKRG